MTIATLSHIKKVIEACLLTATDVIAIDQLLDVFDNQISEDTVRLIVEELASEYTDSGIELITLASGYRFRSRPEFQSYLNKLYNTKPARYSRAVMETLAIIAYRQPVTRGEIENLRGVAVNSNIVQLLFDRNWIEVVGHKQLPGKPELLATTRQFLDDMGIQSLEELPPLPNINETFLNSEQDLIEEYDSQKESEENV
ncbi:SMC-Scp complex subunit ScpB [Aquella oligotrophica]|uniref:SMC-Scp complex subunit ScpB n=1 Tax=Aquella oligotrophica TaxID=2067065 RepID=A0A2I7N8I2_9NEIS|nr:SMC-Scp complex subunit ScpB [Aquella oligotrophica]AUR52760.1 SMC-Scp complex subunit ScpB [Aquella oligotrophica]